MAGSFFAFVRVFDFFTFWRALVSDSFKYFFSYSSSSCCRDFFLGSDFGFLCAVSLVAFVCSSTLVSNSEIFLVRFSRAVSLVELSPISPSAVKAKPPAACCFSDPASGVTSGSGVGSGTSEVEGELGSGFSVPQLVQNF